MAKRFPSHRIKKNSSYTVEELADVLGASIGTIRRCLKSGMQAVDEKRPMLILGAHAIEFLDENQMQAKRPLQLDEFYCLSCRAPRNAFGGMADIVSPNGTSIRMQALCGTCEKPMNKCVSLTQLAGISELIDVAHKGARQA